MKQSALVCACHRDGLFGSADGRGVVFPRRCATVPNRIHVQCRKCKEILALDFEGLEYSNAVKALKALDVPKECPGHNSESGGWWHLWQFDAALVLVYGLDLHQVVHTNDEQCDLDKSKTCIACGVYHGDPCPSCQGRGFHNVSCQKAETFSNVHATGISDWRPNSQRPDNRR